MASIVLKNVDKVYPGGNKAVDKFNLEVADKEFIVLVGPSGCGKSTTLRMIAGLEENTGGEIYIGDELVNGVEPKNRNIAMVFQSYALYRHMTVYENMAFSLKLKKMPKDDIDKRIHEIAEILGISHLLKRKPNALSGGECQRVALGRALVRNPKVFLFDEPLSNLDAKLRTAMRAELIKLHQSLQTTFVYVTHDQTEAMTMGDRIVIMDHGKIQQVDTPQNIYEHPINIFTAGFIGTPQMNFFKTQLQSDDDGFFAEICGNRIALNDVCASKTLMKQYEGTQVTLGIRPENLHICKEAEKASGLGEAVVDFVELLGAGMNVHLKSGETEFVLTAPSDASIRNGKKVYVAADLNKIHIFNTETGVAVTGTGFGGGDAAE